MEMRTYSGLVVDLNNFSKEHINLIDMAMSLSRQNRYLGHSLHNFSVGQHSIFASMIADTLGDNDVVKEAMLLHDAHEVWFQDIIAPVLGSYPNEPYLEARRKADDVIFDFFGVRQKYNSDTMRNRIKTLDKAAGVIERMCLFPTYSWDDESKNVAAPVRKVVDTLIDMNFKIPVDLLSMPWQDVAENLYEIFTVIHFENNTGSTIVLEETDGTLVSS